MDAKQKGVVSEKTELIYQSARSSQEFRADVGMKDFLDVLNIFWETPSEDMREICIDSFFRRSESAFLYDGIASWLEEHIPLVLENEKDRGQQNPYWERLLAPYLFNFNYKNGRTLEMRTRALEFSIALLFSEKSKKEGGLYTYDARSLLFKMIAGAIRKYPELYWAPSVPEFLEASLAHENWTIRERAIELICLAGDTSFFERIAELSRKEKQAQDMTEDYNKKENVREELAGGKLRGFLEKATYLLLLCKTEEKSDVRKFEGEVVQIVQKIGELGIEPHVEFSCPEQVPDGMGFSVALTVLPQSFVIDSKGSHYHIREGASLGVLARCALWLKADGAEISDGDRVEPILHRQGERSIFFSPKDAKDTARFTILPSNRKTVRLTVTFAYQEDITWQEKVKLTRYVHRVE